MRSVFYGCLVLTSIFVVITVAKLEKKTSTAPTSTTKEAKRKFGSGEDIINKVKDTLLPNAVKGRKKRASLTQTLLGKASTVFAKYPWILTGVSNVFTKIQGVKNIFGKKSEKSAEERRKKRHIIHHLGDIVGAGIRMVIHAIFNGLNNILHHHHRKKKRDLVDFEPAYIGRKKYKNINKMSLEKENDIQLLYGLFEEFINGKLPTMKFEEEQNPANEKPTPATCAEA